MRTGPLAPLGREGFFGKAEGSISVDLPNQGPTVEDFARWIDLSGENDFIDAKQHFAWDGSDASASLAKDIAAFANSRDGGVLVIGKAEMPDGSYALQGVTPEQAASFDTTV